MLHCTAALFQSHVMGLDFGRFANNSIKLLTR